MKKKNKPFALSNQSFKTALCLILALPLLYACEYDYVPKPKGLNRIDLPVQTYQKFDIPSYPYSFEYATSAKILPDSSKISEPYWIHVNYPKFKADIQITYKNINGNTRFFEEFIDDSHRLMGKHSIKAQSIEGSVIKTPSGKTAAVYELEGEVPSQFQFYISDSTRHFLRGAVYFRTATQNDSLQPLIEFMKQDVIHMLNTLDWREPKQ